MDVKELKNKLNKKEDLLLIDVREPSELEDIGKIEEAKNIPMNEMLSKASENEIPKDKKIVVVCRTDGRSQAVANKLKNKGFNIDYLEGGMVEWSKNN